MKQKHQKTQNRLKKLSLAKQAYAMHDNMLGLLRGIHKEPETTMYSHEQIIGLIETITIDFIKISELIRDIFVQEIYEKTGKRPPKEKSNG